MYLAEETLYFRLCNFITISGSFPGFSVLFAKLENSLSIHIYESYLIESESYKSASLGNKQYSDCGLSSIHLLANKKIYLEKDLYPQ